MLKKRPYLAIIITIFLLFSIINITTNCKASNFHTIYGYVTVDDETAQNTTIKLTFPAKTYNDKTNSLGQYTITIGYDDDLENQIGSITIIIDDISIFATNYTVPQDESLERVDININSSSTGDDDDDTSGDDDDDTPPPSDDDDDTTPPPSNDDDDDTGPGPIGPILDDDDDDNDDNDAITPIPNNAPRALAINGKNLGKINTNYEFAFIAIDDDGHDIRYEIDWGDENSNISDYIENNTVYITHHNWENVGVYTITFEAFDKDYDASSGNKTHMIYINTYPVDNNNGLNGYFIDENNDNIYEMFYNYSDKTKTDVTYENESYYLDLNQDGTADYQYTSEGTVTKLLPSSKQDEENIIDNKNKSDSISNTIIYIGGLSVLVVLIIFFLFLSKKYKNKK